MSAGTAPAPAPGAETAGPVTAPAGFRAAGVTAGLKASGRPDVALVVNDGPLARRGGRLHHATACRRPRSSGAARCVADGRVDAVVLNSGGANACTGPEGFPTPTARAEHVAAVLGISAGDVAVCSTGLIGERLPDGPAACAGVDAAAAGARRRRRRRRRATRS